MSAPISQSESEDEAIPAPITVVMITLNEGHNLPGALENLKGFASEVLIVDSYSDDDTVDAALSAGARIVQRRFRGFGDQWDFAVNKLPIRTPWTMKLDPDERISPALKAEIRTALARDDADALVVPRRLWFMGRPLSAKQDLLRIWRTGSCRFSPVLVNEHPVVHGSSRRLRHALEHHDSPNLHHWLEKQNAYTTAEAISGRSRLAAEPRLFGSSLQRRMFLKLYARSLPGMPVLMFFYCFFVQGAWKSGSVGWIWASLRADVYRLIKYKEREMQTVPYDISLLERAERRPDSRVPQLD